MRAQLNLHDLIPMKQLGMMIGFLRFQIDPGDKHPCGDKIGKLILFRDLAIRLLPSVQGREDDLNLMFR